MDIIEPGSLDLDAVHLRIGGIYTADHTPMEKGNKFIVVEHFTDPQGEVIDEKIFDASRMCYALFIAPEDNDTGRHRNILQYHGCVPGEKGRIVGGGLLKVENAKASLSRTSGDFSAEPEDIRKKFSHLLLPELQKLQSAENLSIEVATISFESTNHYWLRFRQVLEVAEKHFGEESREALKRRIGWFKRDEERYRKERAQS